MANVLALIPDLLFGSRVQASLTQAGHEVEMVARRSEAESRCRSAQPPEVLIVDLTDDRMQGPELVEALRASAAAGPGPAAAAQALPKTLGFYSHVDTATRERAQSAGFELVVPRSRMAREGAELVGRLAGESRRTA